MPTRSTVAVTALAALLLVVGVLAAALSGPLTLEGRPAEAPPTPTSMPTVPEISESALPDDVLGQLPASYGWVSDVARLLQVLAAVAGLAVLVLVLRYMSRGWRLDQAADDEEEPSPGDEAGDELADTAVAALREGVRQAQRAIQDDVPPGDAVIGAWVAVETAAARTGVVRDPAETASELAVRVLGATRADPAATRELLRLYLAARYGAHGVGPDDVRRAADLLEVVGQGLVPRTEPDATPDAGAAAAGPDADDGRPADRRPADGPAS